MTKHAAPIDEDYALADKVIEWLEALQERADKGEELSDFLHNLTVYSRSGCVNQRGVGIVAAAIVAYKRETEEKVARAEKVSVHVGNVGDKLDFKVRIVGVFESAGTYGVTYIHRFEVLEGPHTGATLTWFGSNKLKHVDDPYKSHEQGDECYVYGTVKKLDEFRGVKQTVMTRVSSVLSPEAREAFIAAQKAEKKTAAKAKRDAKKAEKSAQAVQEKTT